MSEVVAATPAAQATPQAEGVAQGTNPPPAAASQAGTQPPAAGASQAAGSVAGDGKGAGTQAPPAEKPVVPEKYDLKLPEGSPMKAARVETIASYAKEQGLSNEQAQSLLEREHSAVAEHVADAQTQWKQTQDAWIAEAQADKEIGGEAFKENVEHSKRVVDRFASEAFKKTLNDTGFGNHPELVRVFSRIGKLMAEDKLVLPNAQASGESVRIQDVFYPSMRKES